MKGSLLHRFSLVSFLVFFVLAGGLSLVVSSFIKAQVLDILARDAAEHVQDLLHTKVRLEPAAEEHHAELAQLLEEKILGENILGMKILGIKVWDAAGMILFSDDSSVIGKQLAQTGEVKKALAGHVLAKVTRLSRGRTAAQELRNNSVVEVYAPMKNQQGAVAGVYKLYLDASLLYRSASKAYYMVGIALLGGFVLVYIFLYKFFKSVSDTIEEQSASLITLQMRLNAVSQEKENTYLGTVKALLGALNAKDNYTAGHSVRVADFATRIGRELGLPECRLKILEEAALFHDIGKIGIPEHILNKPGALTAQEFEEIKKHPVIGAQIIGAVESLAEQVLIIRHHHERYDGNGYPDGLAGQEIPLESRILAVADTYDAITSERPYHRALTATEAMAVLGRCRGMQLDPDVVDAFLAVLARQGAWRRRAAAM